jgi:hypothetical protein
MKPIEKEFSQGVKILLERMENNPEDFINADEPPYHSPKFKMFADLMHDVIRGDKVKHWQDWYLFTKAEQTALIEGYKNMMRAKFDQGVMRKLLGEPVETIIKKEYYGKPLTIDQITREALETLEKEFDKGMLQPKQFLLNATQWNLANKLAKK